MPPITPSRTKSKVGRPKTVDISTLFRSRPETMTMTVKEIASIAGCSENSVHRGIRELKEQGLLVRVTMSTMKWVADLIPEQP